MKFLNPSAPLKDVHGVVMLDEKEMARQQSENENPLQWWIDTAREAYTASYNYYEVTMMRQHQDNLDNFQSRHPADSRYHGDMYRYRSRLFKPKTRIASRQLEEDAAEMFFGTDDLVSIKPVNINSKEDQFAADVQEHLVQKHLDESLSYFEMTLGGVQDAFKQGDVVSGVGWESAEQEKDRERDLTTFDGESGDMLWEAGDTYAEPVMEYNRPTFRLIPIENIHLDPGFVWNDPIGTSPYIIEDMPMHIQKVQERMAEPGQEPQGNQWKHVPTTVLLSATQATDSQESIRAKRQGDTLDPLSSNAYRTVEDHMIVMVRRVILDVDGEDWLYYMVGNEALLSEPVPLLEVAPWLKPGERDYQWGYAGIETHRTYKSAPAEWLKDLQAAANIEHNARSDNIALALNKRYKVKRNAVKDFASLRMSVPGGIYEVDDMADVEPEQWSDIGGSSFYNEDRLVNDFDALGGSFDQGSVASQRNMNETVGGMRMMQQRTGKARSYMLLTITVTWWQKVMDALHRMVIEYSTEDEVIDAVDELLADDEPVPGVQPLDLLKVKCRVKINMRLGSDPMSRMNNLMAIIANFADSPVAQRLDWDELFKEGAGAAGFGDGDRFMMPVDGMDPAMQQLVQENEQLRMMVETKQLEMQNKIEVAQVNAQARLQAEQMKGDMQRELALMERELKLLDHEISLAETDIKREELELAREGLIHQINTARFNMRKEMKDLSKQDAESNASGIAGTMARDDYGKVMGATG